MMKNNYAVVTKSVYSGMIENDNSFPKIIAREAQSILDNEYAEHQNQSPIASRAHSMVSDECI